MLIQWSRPPLSTNEKIGGVCFDSIFNLGQLEALPLTAKQLALATSTDSICPRSSDILKLVGLAVYLTSLNLTLIADMN